MIIGITGRSGSGKTTFLKVLEERGARILDCDAIYHWLLEEDQEFLQKIEAEFSGVVVNGILRRKTLGQIVFGNSSALRRLNQITHGRVREEVIRLLADRPKLVAIDAIALHESGLAELCDFTVAITAPEGERIRRVMKRDIVTEEYARSRIFAQPTDQWFRENCDYFLHNGDTEEAFREKCVAFLDRFCIMEENE